MKSSEKISNKLTAKDNQVINKKYKILVNGTFYAVTFLNS